MAIKTFKNWLKENKVSLDQLDVEEKAEKTDVEKGEKPTEENRLRTGWSKNYPPAYASGQYPHKYMNPVKATADLDAQNMNRKD